MIMTEFYRMKLLEINKEIMAAEDNKDFKKVAKLEVEKAEIKERLKEY